MTVEKHGSDLLTCFGLTRNSISRAGNDCLSIPKGKARIGYVERPDRARRSWQEDSHYPLPCSHCCS
jgi:hypothetical protein